MLLNKVGFLGGRWLEPEDIHSYTSCLSPAASPQEGREPLEPVATHEKGGSRSQPVMSKFSSFGLQHAHPNQKSTS